MMSATRPEHQLLSSVACRSRNTARSQQIRLLVQRELDWEYLLAIADRHSLIPLLYFHLNAVAPSSVPDRVMCRLQDANRKSTQSSLFLAGELIKVLEFLEANGIQAVPFKGPTLALRAYGDVGLRQFSDLDILVHAQDVIRVRRLLVSRGFKPTPQFSAEQEAALLRFDCAHNLDNGAGVVVDVHWKFVERHSSFAINPDPLWDRLEPITIGDKQLLTLSTEDLLLILCLHGFTHLWERLGWICDVASLVDSRKDLNWPLVLENVDRLGLRRVLLLGLLVAADVLDATIPKEIRQAATGDATVQRLAGQVQEQLFLEQSTPPGFFGGAILNLRMRERRLDRLGSFLRLIFTPRSYDWMFLSLPEWLLFLYYPLRPLRLAGKYGAKLVKAAAGFPEAGADSAN